MIFEALREAICALRGGKREHLDSRKILCYDF